MNENTKAVDVLAPVPALTVLEFHANGFGNADNRGMTLSAKACGNIAAELREARAAVAELMEGAADIMPSGDPEWIKIPGGKEVATLAVRREAWDRFSAALSRIGGAK